MFFNSVDVNYMDFFLTVTAYNNTSWYEDTIIYILIVMGI